MKMSDSSFGRMVRRRRAKLGLSQAKLAELVGRSSATVRSWERDKTRPTDPKVLSVLSAVLGVEEREVFSTAEVEVPIHRENDPTVEQALATLAPVRDTPRAPARHASSEELDGQGSSERAPAKELVAAAATVPAYVAPPDPFIQVPLAPTLTDVSYMEDQSQRQMYRVRTLATLVALVALVIAFIWAVGEGLGAFGVWWDGFFGNLRF